MYIGQNFSGQYVGIDSSSIGKEGLRASVPRHRENTWQGRRMEIGDVTEQRGTCSGSRIVRAQELILVG